MAKDKPKTPPKYRDAGTGQYVKPGYAKKHPKTTVKEEDVPIAVELGRRSRVNCLRRSKQRPRAPACR